MQKLYGVVGCSLGGEGFPGGAPGGASEDGPSVEKVDQGCAPRSFCIWTALHIKTECTLHLHVDRKHVDNKHHLYYIHFLLSSHGVNELGEL